jgi:membrane protein DedA with SNARE-associated domain
MTVHLSQLIPTHGYWLAFVGALLEGETMLALAGLAANQGYLAVPALIVVGAAGGLLGDQILFAIGRRFGARVLGPFPRIARRAGRATRLIERYPRFSVIAVRFIYGLRIIGPIAIGMSRIGRFQFAALNAFGAAIWSACWVGAGYVAGSAVEASVGNLKHVEHIVMAIALAVAIVATIVLRLWRRREPAETPQLPQPAPISSSQS